MNLRNDFESSIGFQEESRMMYEVQAKTVVFVQHQKKTRVSIATERLLVSSEEAQLMKELKFELSWC